MNASMIEQENARVRERHRKSKVTLFRFGWQWFDQRSKVLRLWLTTAREFPALLIGGFTVKNATEKTNCHAYAIGITDDWFDPNCFWPEGVDKLRDIQTFTAAFEAVGFTPCESMAVETGVEKIALFISGAGYLVHTARQQRNGRWSSKLGGFWLINNHRLRAIEGRHFGRMHCIMRRAR